MGMKRFLLLVLLMAGVLAFAGCEKEESKPSETASGAGAKYLMFYSRNCYLGYVDIYINNLYAGTITSCYGSQPACGSAGCVTVQIYGAFTWYAVRRSDGYVYSSNIMTYTGCNAYYFY